MATSRSSVSGITNLQRLNHKTHSPERSIPGLIVMILMLIAAAYFLLPIIWLFISTTKTSSDLFNTPMLSFPKQWQFWHNLKVVSSYQGGQYWRWYLNSAIYSTVTAVLATIISAMAGYVLSKYSFKARGVMFSLVLASLLIPGAALTIPIFLLIKVLGLMNTYVGVIIPSLASPFGAYFMNVYIGEAMPTEFIDSGRVDGASDWQIFWKIAIPIIRPGLVTFFLISFIGMWNNFFLPLLILSDSSKFPLPLGLQVWSTYISQAGTGAPPYAQIIMGAFLSVLPMIVLFPFLRKYIAAGMMTGGLKM